MSAFDGEPERFVLCLLPVGLVAGPFHANGHALDVLGVVRPGGREEVRINRASRQVQQQASIVYIKIGYTLGTDIPPSLSVTRRIEFPMGVNIAPVIVSDINDWLSPAYEYIVKVEHFAGGQLRIQLHFQGGPLFRRIGQLERTGALEPLVKDSDLDGRTQPLIGAVELADAEPQRGARVPGVGRDLHRRVYCRNVPIVHFQAAFDRLCQCDVLPGSGTLDGIGKRVYGLPLLIVKVNRIADDVPAQQAAPLECLVGQIEILQTNPVEFHRSTLSNAIGQIETNLIDSPGPLRFTQKVDKNHLPIIRVAH